MHDLHNYAKIPNDLYKQNLYETVGALKAHSACLHLKAEQMMEEGAAQLRVRDLARYAMSVVRPLHH